MKETCTHVEMLANIEIEIQTIMNALLTSDVSDNVKTSLQNEFNNLIYAHNRIGNERWIIFIL